MNQSGTAKPVAKVIDLRSRMAIDLPDDDAQPTSDRPKTIDDVDGEPDIGLDVPAGIKGKPLILFAGVCVGPTILVALLVGNLLKGPLQAISLGLCLWAIALIVGAILQKWCRFRNAGPAKPAIGESVTAPAHYVHALQDEKVGWRLTKNPARKNSWVLELVTPKQCPELVSVSRVALVTPQQPGGIDCAVFKCDPDDNGTTYVQLRVPSEDALMRARFDALCRQLNEGQVASFSALLATVDKRAWRLAHIERFTPDC